jgi:hypothetical protein
MLPEWVNALGYVSSILAMLGAYLVARGTQKAGLAAFTIWLFTNVFELTVAGYFYHNWWMVLQFSFFTANAMYGIYRWGWKVRSTAV